MRIWGRRWVCDRCGKRLWKADVTKRKTPAPEEVSYAYGYLGSGGFRYTLRGKDGRVLYDSPRAYRSRYDIKNEVARLWPGIPVSFE